MRYRKRDCPIKSLLFHAKFVQTLKLHLTHTHNHTHAYMHVSIGEKKMLLVQKQFQCIFVLLVLLLFLCSIQLEANTGKTTISIQSFLAYSTNTDETAI